MEISTEIWVCIAFIVYYSGLQIYDDFIRYGMATNTKSLRIERLRSKYKVTIRTFHGNKRLSGFAWFKTIWINEMLLNKYMESSLLFTFHHEHYHLKHKHKLKTLLLRLFISLTPLTMIFVNWLIFIGILLSVSYFSLHITDIFENKANDYAKKMVKNAD